MGPVMSIFSTIGRIVWYIYTVWIIYFLIAMLMRKKSRFLRLPVEIQLLVAAQLRQSSSPESVVALALTCKRLFSVLSKDVEELKKSPGKRAAFLTLLEKELGDRFFFCSECCQLHRFDPSWSPVRPTHTCYRLGCPLLDSLHSFSPNLWRSRYDLKYVHVRLVMNRHLYGGSKGLPLEALSRPCWVESTEHGLLWLQTPSARIHGDDLMLCVTHTLEGREAAVRFALDKGRYSICTHIITHPTTWSSPSYKYRIPETRKPKQSGNQTSTRLQACRDILNTCHACSTDYTITIERSTVCETRKTRNARTVRRGEIREEPAKDGWRVTITSFHLIGRCRNINDAEWMSLAKFDPIRLDKRRDVTLFPPGTIRQMWQVADTR